MTHLSSQHPHNQDFVVIPPFAPDLGNMGSE